MDYDLVKTFPVKRTKPKTFDELLVTASMSKSDSRQERSALLQSKRCYLIMCNFKQFWIRIMGCHYVYWHFYNPSIEFDVVEGSSHILRR
ncbi:hypothetical protein PROFUN_12651 [Planoprotostelium fungivorum]|uniref:Uncharacterized protein n=1 Tax=Planoprotostelium fungivorum TaxID=1890364 RepID=A0A2P6N704_9EUKA|nr:hypothetical protein PROFUN_12651 [Planoprotostelium fungivorum]